MRFLLLLVVTFSIAFGNDKGVVFDKKQQIIWHTCKSYSMRKQATIWRMSKSFCQNLYFLGGNGWRLPTPHELHNGMKNNLLKELPQGTYWTSKLDPKDPEDNAIAVFSKNGYISTQDRCEAAYFVCVQ